MLSNLRLLAKKALENFGSLFELPIKELLLGLDWGITVATNELLGMVFQVRQQQR